MYINDLFFIPYQNNATPLHVASQKGHQDVVQSLLGAGADVNTATSDVSNDILYLWSSQCKCKGIMDTITCTCTPNTINTLPYIDVRTCAA